MVERPVAGSIPDAPGSYQFLDGEGRPIYIGKASSLRSRISSYFQDSSGLAYRTKQMVEAAERLEWTVTATELEALILEHGLIQRHQPRFNVRLKDDKSYPWLAISVNEEWPRPMVLRGKRRRGLRYFGPFVHTRSLRTTLDLLLRAYPVRSCSNTKFKSHQRLGRPCLLADIGKCSAPCTGKIAPEAYAEILGGFVDALEGNLEPLKTSLNAEMQVASASMEYELAARARNRLAAVEQVAESQEIVLPDAASVDFVGFAADPSGASLSVLRVRHGRIIGRTGAMLEGSGLDDDLLLSGVVDYYGLGGLDWPREIVLSEELVDATTLRQWLRTVTDQAPKLSQSVRGTRRSLLDRAQFNAEADLRRDRLQRASDYNARSQALLALQEALGMTEAPLRIECFDMSHFQGTHYVGSMVVFEDGLARRDAYRRFEVKTVAGNDDFAAMREVLRRRLAYLKVPREGEGPQRFGYRPQLLVIDGGKGQLSEAVAAIAELHIEPAPAVIGLAKRYEEIFLPGRSAAIILDRQSPALFLLQQLRDEAHRFAIGFHRQRRGKAMVESLLDGVAGLGPRRREQLLEHFGTVSAVREASLEDLESLGWLPVEVAEALWNRLRGLDPREVAPHGPEDQEWANG